MTSINTSTTIKYTHTEHSLSTLNSSHSDTDLLKNKTNLLASKINAVNMDEQKMSSEFSNFLSKKGKPHGFWT